MLYLWEASTGSVQQEWASPYYASVSWRPDSNEIALGAFIGVLLLNPDVDFASMRTELEEPTGDSGYPSISTIKWNFDGSLLAISTRFGGIRIFDRAQRKAILTVEPNALHTADKFIDEVLWSPSGDQIASSSVDNTIKVWSADIGKVLATYQRRPLPSVGHPMSWSPTGARLAYIGARPAEADSAGYWLSLADDTVQIVVPVATAKQLDQVIGQCTSDPATADTIRALLTQVQAVEASVLDTYDLTPICRDDLSAMLQAIS